MKPPKTIGKVMRSCHADDDIRLGFILPKMLMIMSKVMMPCHFDSTLCGFDSTNGTYRLFEPVCNLWRTAEYA